MLMKVFLINFWWFTRLRYFMECTLIVIKSIAKISYIAFYVLFRTRATVKFINSKICVAIYNSFTNIILIPINVFKLQCLFNILTNLPTFSITLGTFRFFSVSVSNFCPYQIILKMRALRQPIMGGFFRKVVLCSSLCVRSTCVSFKSFWKSISNEWYVRLKTSRSSTRGSLSLLSNVSLDTALAIRICFLNSFCLYVLPGSHFSNGCHERYYSSIFGSIQRLYYKESTYHNGICDTTICLFYIQISYVYI